jgi:dipeptidyl aminopeptidase/acylaminoacyl peptidase
MSAERFIPALALSCLAGLAGAAQPPAAEPTLPFTVQDMVRMERISEVAVAPDGKRVAYTQRTTDMEANKGRTGVWLLDTGKRGATPLRLTDGCPIAAAPTRCGASVRAAPGRAATRPCPIPPR